MSYSYSKCLEIYSFVANKPTTSKRQFLESNEAFISQSSKYCCAIFSRHLDTFKSNS